MEDFALVEADFQQYYHINLEAYTCNRRRGFGRFVRLLMNLPKEARFFAKYIPEAVWEYRDAAMSMLLYKLDVLTTMYANTNRKKGSKRVELPNPEERFLPEYIRMAEERVREEEKSKHQVDSAEIDKMTDFWRSRNPGVKFR